MATFVSLLTVVVILIAVAAGNRYVDWIASAFALFFLSMLLPIPEWKQFVNDLPNWMGMLVLTGGCFSMIYLFFRAASGFRGDDKDGYHGGGGA